MYLVSHGKMANEFPLSLHSLFPFRHMLLDNYRPEITNTNATLREQRNVSPFRVVVRYLDNLYNLSISEAEECSDMVLRLPFMGTGQFCGALHDITRSMWGCGLAVLYT